MPPPRLRLANVLYTLLVTLLLWALGANAQTQPCGADSHGRNTTLAVGYMCVCDSTYAGVGCNTQAVNCSIAFSTPDPNDLTAVASVTIHERRRLCRVRAVDAHDEHAPVQCCQDRERVHGG